MKKPALLLLALLLGAGSLALAQTGGSSDNKIKTAGSGKKGAKTRTAHKKVTTGGATHGSNLPQPQPDSKVALNPQPLPPGAKVSNPKTDAGAKVGFNPQPDPPRTSASAVQHNTNRRATDSNKSKNSSVNTNAGAAPK